MLDMNCVHIGVKFDSNSFLLERVCWIWGQPDYCVCIEGNFSDPSRFFVLFPKGNIVNSRSYLRESVN